MRDAPLQVYVGTQQEHLLPYQVLAFTIRKHAEVPVETIPLHEAIASAGIVIPEPIQRKNVPHTPFSLQRFAIPQLNGYRGVAVYLDSDMLVFRNIGELVNLADPDAEVSAAAEPPNSGRKSQISVMVLKCERLNWDVRRITEDLDRGVYSYRQLYSDLPIATRFSRSIPHFWNDLERHTPGVTALTHFTDMETQPWLHADSMLGRLWCECLFEALGAGSIAKEFIVDQVIRGWVRPTLGYQVEQGIIDPSTLSDEIRRMDAFGFTPPHRVGIIWRKWARSLACNVTDYGKNNPGRRAMLMRNLQAVAYQAYKRLRSKHLNARL